MIYADNAATTPLSKAAFDAMTPYLCDCFYNPSSLYTAGQKAKEALEDARRRIARLIGASAKEIYFTSGGSESDNQAILTAARLGKRAGKTHIVTSSIEHHAVLHPIEELRKEGFRVSYLPAAPDGIVQVSDLQAALCEDTCLVSVMTANNEIGTIQPIRELAEICRERKIPFHTDAVQAVGHLPIDVTQAKIDLLSASAHKFHGPKGVGFLFAGKGLSPSPLIRGGAQERSRRAGTENVAGIVGMAAALEESVSRMEETAQKLSRLRDRLIASLASEIPHAALNGDAVKRLPSNVSFCFEGIEGEALLLLLDDRGICASSGSACTSGSLDPSHVLLAIGRPHDVAHGSLRITLGEDADEETVDRIARDVKEVVEHLRGFSPVWRSLCAGKSQFIL